MVIVAGSGHGDTRLIAFHFALIPLGKVWIQSFSLQLWKVGQTRFFSLGEAASLGEGKLWIQTCQTPLKNWPCVISCPKGPGFNPRSSHTKDSKNVSWCCVAYTQNYKERIKGKEEQSRKMSNAFPYTSV